jgi:hypothetical protein
MRRIVSFRPHHPYRRQQRDAAEILDHAAGAGDGRRLALDIITIQALVIDISNIYTC